MGLPALQYAPTLPGRIHRAGFGWTNIGGHVFEHDRVIHPEGISGVWWRNKRHTLDCNDVLAIADVHRPQLLIVGAGWMGMLRVDVAALQQTLRPRGVELIVQRTPQAIVTYQQRRLLGLDPVLALHVTC